MRYFSFEFITDDEAQREILIARLDAIGFEGFEEVENKLLAYIDVENFIETDFNTLLHAFNPFPAYQKTEISDQNWNELWEKNFKPIIIGNDIAVRSSFHPPFPDVRYEIIIDPKMSFGTGHHATTSMMMQLMLQEDFKNKSVLDFGSGTGILSILASQRGALCIQAVDIDEWAFKNATENFELNSISNATAVLDQAYDFTGKNFDVILANVSREVNIKSMPQFSDAIKTSGLLMLSGFLKKDEPDIVAAAQQKNFHVTNMLSENDWMAITFVRV
jgi:ribosomal protein L11 methyltransferase